MSDQIHRIGNWVWHKKLNQPVKILGINENWGYSTYEVWSDSEKKSIQVKFNEITNLSESVLTKNKILLIVSASRILEAYASEKILSPVESKIIPLPHQINVLSNVMKSTNGIRF